MSIVAPRVVIVTRPTEVELLVARHGTHGQARFVLESHGRSFDELLERHRRRDEALAFASAAIPARWRRARVDRADLSRFVFGPEDLVVIVGQDGLVANVAKYLHAQPVVGVNPDPDRYDGVLVRHRGTALRELLPAVQAQRVPIETRTMVQAQLDDGQRIVALNEVFVGHLTHQSARYRITWGRHEEPHSSSGVVVASGTGATGWARSIARQLRDTPPLPTPTDRAAVFFVREPFPSVSSRVEIEHGVLDAQTVLTLRSEMDDHGTIFGDGIEDDRLTFGYGRTVAVTLAPERLHLVMPSHG